MRQLEAKYLLLCGNAFRYSYYDKNKKGAPVVIPKVGSGVLPGYKSSMCTSCDYTGTGEETCPQCDAPMENITIPAQEISKGVQSYETVNSGEVHLEIVDPIEIKVWAGAQELSQSPYIRRKRLVRAEFLKEIFPHFKPTADAKLSDAGARLSQFYDTSNEKEEADKANKLLEYNQIWLDPSYYADKKLKNTVKLLNGEEIAAGTPYIDAFPQGMYYCVSGKTVLGYAKEYKQDCWVHIPFDNNVDGFWADGLEDAIQNQQIINEYNSLGVENVLHNASPKLVINPRLLNPATVTGRPKDMLLMNDNANSEKKPNDAFGQITGMSLTPEVTQAIDAYKRDMREQTGALLAFNGQGDPTISTATGMSIARDSALALVSTALAIRAEKEIEWCWQIIKYVKKHFYDQKYKFLLGKFNESEAIAFKTSKLEEDLNLSVEAGSWVPLTNQEKLENLSAYLTAFGLPLGFLNPQIPESIREYASQIFNIPLDMNEIAVDTRIAQKRLNRAKEAYAKLSVVPQLAQDPEELQLLAETIPATIANIMTVEEDIDDHEVFIAEYVKWLKTDEGQNADPLLRTGVKKAIADHRMFLQVQMQAQQQQMMQDQYSMEQGGTFEPTKPAENPFNPPKQEVQDFSRNRPTNKPSNNNSPKSVK